MSESGGKVVEGLREWRQTSTDKLAVLSILAMGFLVVWRNESANDKGLAVIEKAANENTAMLQKVAEADRVADENLLMIFKENIKAERAESDQRMEIWKQMTETFRLVAEQEK